MYGSAALRFAVRDGRTALTDSRTSPPLGVQRSLYLDDGLPGLAFVHLLNPTAGVFAGDSLSLCVRVERGARAHLTGQAALRIHAMPEGHARQRVSLQIEAGGYLEYLPDPAIPYAGSAFEQDVEIVVEDGGALVYADILLAGRLAHGERYRFRRYASTLTLLAQSGRPLLRESYCLEPGGVSLFDAGIVGDPAVGAMLTVIVVTTEGLTPLLLPSMGSALSAVAPGSAGIGPLIGDRGVVAKALTANAWQARRALAAVWRAARRRLLGVDLPPVWKR